MLDKTRTATRGLVDDLLDVNRQVVDWQLDLNRRAERQVAAAFDASRAALSAAAELQRSTTRAWLDLVAPDAAKAGS